MHGTQNEVHKFSHDFRNDSLNLPTIGLYQNNVHIIILLNFQ